MVHDRGSAEIRSLDIQIDALGYASASVLLSLGNTKVLAAITLQPGVPHFLKGQQVGWLTAEYAMLPCATQQRTQRESTAQQRNSRSVEISRLIGRCLRAVVDLNVLRERTIFVDCEVLQADGGTRVACLTAASLALEIAFYRWKAKGLVDASFFKERIAAISVGKVDGKNCLDLSFEEDSIAQADFNFVMTQSGKLIEVQGTAEKEPLSFEEFDEMKLLAKKGIESIFERIAKNLLNDSMYQELISHKNTAKQNTHAGNASLKEQKTSLFSIGSRIGK